MSTTFILAGQRVEMTSSGVDAMARELVAKTRFPVHHRVTQRFNRWYDQWQVYEHRYDYNVLLWAFEVAGLAGDLPSRSTARRLAARRDWLRGRINQRGLLQYYDNVGRWHEQSHRFCRDMSRYNRAVGVGGGRVAAITQFTRDASFEVLKVAATVVATGGAGAPAAAAGAAATLARAAAVSFTIDMIQRSATDIGQRLSGERGGSLTIQAIHDSAIGSLTDAMLGEVVGKFIGPLKDHLTRAAAREISNGRLARGTALALIENRLGTVVENTIKTFVRSNPDVIRGLLELCIGPMSETGVARRTGNGLIANARFRQTLERKIQEAA